MVDKQLISLAVIYNVQDLMNTALSGDVTSTLSTSLDIDQLKDEGETDVKQLVYVSVRAAVHQRLRGCEESDQRSSTLFAARLPVC